MNIKLQCEPFALGLYYSCNAIVAQRRGMGIMIFLKPTEVDPKK